MYQIPAIEWSEISLNGDTTLGSPIISGIADTSLLEVGMVIYGNGIPYNSRIDTVASNSITISEDATAIGSGVSISAYFRIDFTYPASTDQGERARADQSISKSLSGIRQNITNHIEITRDLSFNFINKTDRDSLRDDFYLGWAIYGKSFRYFEDKEINSVIIYENNSADYTQTRTIKKHPDYLYEISFRFRRIR